MSVESLDEGITDDESFTELSGQVKTHDSDNTYIFAKFGYFQDVIFTLKAVLVTSNDEVKSGELGKGAAVDLFLFSGSESFCHVFDDFSGTNDDRCSSVDYTQKIANFVAGSVEDDIVHSDTPVSSHAERVVFEVTSVVFAVDTSQN